MNQKLRENKMLLMAITRSLISIGWKKPGFLILLLFMLLLPSVKQLYGCTAAFTVDNSTPVVGQTVKFTATDNSAAISAWSWNFGSGAIPPTANTKGPHNVYYSTTGSKTVTLTITY
jgi:hypothetical protein